MDDDNDDDSIHKFINLVLQKWLQTSSTAYG
jgi:hypothetical protein